jgi:hypothetical protein
MRMTRLRASLVVCRQETGDVLPDNYLIPKPGPNEVLLKMHSA